MECARTTSSYGLTSHLRSWPFFKHLISCSIAANSPRSQFAGIFSLAAVIDRFLLNQAHVPSCLEHVEIALTLQAAETSHVTSGRSYCQVAYLTWIHQCTPACQSLRGCTPLSVVFPALGSSQGLLPRPSENVNWLAAKLTAAGQP